jgi:glycosyltransferase involved in cell wall biosynthesis
LVPELRRLDEKIVSGKKWRQIWLPNKPSVFKRTIYYLKSFVGKNVYQRIGWENSWQLGTMASLLFKEVRKKEADLIIGHLEGGMWAAEKLRKQGKRVGVDMEDWFSEDLLPVARRTRPIRLLKKLEKNLLCHGVHSTCTSEAMADALVEAYGCRRPTVIRNVFPREDREALDGKWKDRPGMAKWIPRNDPRAARPKEAPVSIHWFSQSIGPGRGLETLFGALVSLQGNWEVHLRGNLKGHEKWLERACPVSVQAKLKVHELVDNNELLSRIAEHDIAFAGELSEPPSRNLTITNKFFQYLQAGLAVIASDTAGQTEAAKEAGGAVFVVPSNKPDGLKAILAELLNSPELLRAQKQQSWIAADRLNWEKESRKLVSGLFSA